MEARFSCETCRAASTVMVGEAEVTHRCARCGAERVLRFSESLRTLGVADVCAVCGSDHFYVQKDFDQRIGCLVIAVGAALTPWTYGLSLAACAVIDLVLYRSLPDVAKCYVCKATYRGGARNPAHEPFDLHLLEKYEAEARRKAREAGAPARAETEGTP